MNKLIPLALLIVPISVFAQTSNTVKAKVTHVEPVLASQSVPKSVEQCADQDVVTQHKSTLGPSIAGALVGAVIGSQFGGGVGKSIATDVGAVAGMSEGKKLAKSKQHTVRKRVCHQVVDYDTVQVQKYQVSYEFGGEDFVTTMDRRPGSTIDVSVRP